MGSRRRAYEVVGRTTDGHPETIGLAITRYLDLDPDLAGPQDRLVPPTMAAAEQGRRIDINARTEHLMITKPYGSRALIDCYAGQDTPDLTIQDWLQALHRLQAVYLYTGDIHFTAQTTDLEAAHATGTLRMGVATLEYDITPAAPLNPQRRRQRRQRTRHPGQP